MPPRIVTGLMTGRQTPVAERVYSPWDALGDKHWRIWLDYNRTISVGTYLDLHDDGSITRNTVDATGLVIESIIVTPATS